LNGGLLEVRKIEKVNIDDWSRERHTFKTPKGGLLEVLGWTSKVGNNKKYAVKCDVCAKDKELNGFGIYFAVKFDLVKGKIPCGCSLARRWTQRQYEVLLARRLSLKNYSFIGWNNSFKNAYSKIIAECPTHGKWNSTNVNSALKGVGCPKCSGHNQKEAYVNVVYDGEIPVALKFGVASDTSIRLKGQNRRNTFQMVNLYKFNFKTEQSCKKAENTCRAQLSCGILSSRELQDGWSETTNLTNLEKILDILKVEGEVI